MSITPSYINAFTLTSALGFGNDSTLESLRKEQSGLRNISISPSGTTYFGEVLLPSNSYIPEELLIYDNSCMRLIAHGLMQDNFFEQVMIAKEKFGKHRIACFLGTITSALCKLEEIYQENPEQKNYQNKVPLKYHGSINSAVQFTREYLGITGPYATISTACSSSAKVFATAHRYLQAGLCDAAVVAGVEPKCETLIYGFRSLGVLSAAKCCPWDKNRNGINIGAAAGFALMSRQASSADNFTLRGYGETSDGYHMTAPHPLGAGVERSMLQALESAGLNPSNIDYINSHGSGTLMNDITEDGAITRVFGEGMLVSSTKGYTGHTQGAAGITEAIILMLAMKDGFAPANVNTSQVDPQLRCHVPLSNLAKNIRFGLTNSMGFGGNNATIIFGAPI